jgi:hypothetical protein
MAPRHLILIAGMHRSGTSVLTRAISLAGVALPSNLKPPSPNVNADGFWEPLAIKAFHDGILKNINSRWDDPREIPAAWFQGPPFESAREWLTQWIDEEFGDRDMLVVKDPRVCRLLPLWQNTCARMDVAVHAVIIARNPVEVARSLKTRDRFPEQMSLVLWLRHFLDAERYTRNGSRSFVAFERLMEDRLGTLRRIAADLGLVFPVPDSELIPLLDEAIKPSLRHHVAGENDLDMAGDMQPVLRAAWDWAQAAATGPTPSPAPLDEITVLMRRLEQAGAQSAASAQ